MEGGLQETTFEAVAMGSGGKHVDVGGIDVFASGAGGIGVFGDVFRDFDGV
jgi:hypothetical protein